MSDILDRILERKRAEVEERRELYPVRLLEKSIYFETGTVSLKKYIQRQDKSGIIAEIKRKSPSRGVINSRVSVEKISIGYMQAGASALSVLTDTAFFGGSNEDLTTARKFNFCPILRKDFIVDEYQVIEAKSIGADALLLIAAAMQPEKLYQLAACAKQTGLEVLMEVHNADELERYFNEHIDVLGVNNRNLKDFKVDIQTSIDLSERIPKDVVKVSESGINAVDSIRALKQHGYDGFLIGEFFMSQSHPEIACAEFIRKLETGAEHEHV